MEIAKYEECISILEHIQRYAPSVTTTRDVPILASSELMQATTVNSSPLLFGEGQLIWPSEGEDARGSGETH